MTFNLTEARVNAGYSIRAFAKELGIHEHSLRTLERGGSVQPDTAKKVADFFDIKVTDIEGMKVAA